MDFLTGLFVGWLVFSEDGEPIPAEDIDRYSDWCEANGIVSPRSISADAVTAESLAAAHKRDAV